MIAKGTAHNDGAKLASYLITAKGNERAALFQLRGFASDDIREAFRSVHVIAQATRAEQPFFHVQVRTPDGEALTGQQWEKVADRIESKLGLRHQPRAIAFHTNLDTGHTHMHIAWSRIDDETMTARPLPFYKLRLKEVCREIEKDFGLTQVTSQRNGLSMAPTRGEFEQARRLGIDIHGTRAAIRECWDCSDNGQSFIAALEDKNLRLARGARRAFVVVDQAGGIHALGKRLLGHTAAEVRTRLAGIEHLPSVEDVRTQLGCPLRAAELDRIALLSAIEGRECRAVLEAITKQRATFTAYELELILSPAIEDTTERKRFAEDIANHSEIVRIAGAGGRMRYTTTTVLSQERTVIDAARRLRIHDHHEIPPKVRSAVLEHPKYSSISREQVRALRHATTEEGLALITGQAGTGKSYVMSAIRESYQKHGFRVIGLAPTNIVARAMKEDGFAEANTLHSALYALDKGRTRWNQQTVVMVDEAAMVDTRNLSKLMAHAQAASAKLILIGDSRQLSSVERGGLYEVLVRRFGTAELTQVRRQHSTDDRRSSELMAKGDFRNALAGYQKKGGIVWADTQSEAAEALVRQWTHDHDASPAATRFVFAYTNNDVDELNRALRDARQQRGELGRSTRFETKHGPADFAEHDRIQFTGTTRGLGIYNGQVGTVQGINGQMITVLLDGKSQRTITFDARSFQEFRLGYAGTIHKGQGKTIDQSYLFHSEHWRAAASYVALTRHSHEMRMYVARDTTSDLSELAQQVARLDDRRAASYFIEDDQLSKKRKRQSAGVDWHRYLTDSDVPVQGLHGGLHQRIDADRDSGLDR